MPIIGPLVFLDTETTGLRPFADHIWEVAAIIRDQDGTITEHQMFVEHDLALVNELPEQYRQDHDNRYDPTRAIPAADAAHIINGWFAGRKHLVGANPAFDAAMITSLLNKTGGGTPAWAYHLIDVEALTVGRLQAAGHPIELPWKSDQLAEAAGITMTNDDGTPRYQRHTALDDTRWVYDWFNHLDTTAEGPQ